MADVITAPGVFDISEAVYDADPCPEPSLRSSIAKALIAKGSTPAHAAREHPRITPVKGDPEPKRIHDFGRAAHRELLGRGSPIKNIPYDSYRKDAAKASRTYAYRSGHIPVLAPDYETIKEMVAAAHDQIQAAISAGAFEGNPFAEGHAEPTLVWKESDVWCRARPDWLPKDADHIVDYKTTNASADPALWQWRQMREFGMHQSLAFYRRGLEKLGIAHSPRYTFIVQETFEPYLLSVIHVDDELIERADQEMQKAIKIWGRCLREGRFPGYDPQGYVVGLTDRERQAETPGYTGGGHVDSDTIAAGI